MTALTQLGRRVELEADLAELAGTVGTLDDESWTVRLELARAALRLLDGRFADCRAIVDATPGFLAVVMRSHLALLSGDGLAEAEQEVRDAVDGAPFFARGWHALLLVALDRLDEARALWRAIAPPTSDAATPAFSDRLCAPPRCPALAKASSCSSGLSTIAVLCGSRYQ